MAAAVREMGFDEVELAYLKNALDAADTDPEINRICAEALERRKRFDEAIACWHRVQLARPKDEEAPQQVARLAVEKTIDHGGYEQTDPTKKRMPGGDKSGAQPSEEEAIRGLSPHANGSSVRLPSRPRNCRTTGSWPSCTSPITVLTGLRNCWLARSRFRRTIPKFASGGRTPAFAA